MVGSSNTYDILYDIVAENMMQADQKLTYSREAFQTDMNQKCQPLDLLDLRGTNIQFAETVFLHCLHRPMSESDWKHQAELCFLPEKQFRIKMLNTVCDSYEYKAKRGSVVNDIYREAPAKSRGYGKQRVLLAIYHMIPRRLRPTAKSLASKLRSI